MHRPHTIVMPSVECIACPCFVRTRAFLAERSERVNLEAMQQAFIVHRQGPLPATQVGTRSRSQADVRSSRDLDQRPSDAHCCRPLGCDIHLAATAPLAPAAMGPRSLGDLLVHARA
jgi:hypothetical protein